jgi:two-component system, cell cycle response regulator
MPPYTETVDPDKTILSVSDGWLAAGEKRLPVLIVLRGAQIGRRYLLNEQGLVIGRRDTQASVVIPGDPEISGAHCRIEYDPTSDAYNLVDVGSTNGTRLNGEPITRRTRLRDGDKLLLGQTILKFTFHDVVEAEFHREVDRMMNIDELTGLVMLRVFEQRFRQALAACTAGNRPLAVLMMDMDGLKRINETHGHHVGARTIAAVGRLLGGLMGSDGLVTRFGGDEFTAFAPDRNRDAGLALGETIRAALKDHPIDCGTAIVQPTISIGVAAFPEDGETPEKLTRRADEALYRAKAAGRDMVSA